MKFDRYARSRPAGHHAGTPWHPLGHPGAAMPNANTHLADHRLGHRRPGHGAHGEVPLRAHQLGTVLAVWAHPDDESFVAGGLLAAAADAGSLVVCLTATSGERGTADPDRWHPARLGRTRHRELAAAQAILGIHEQRWLPFEDGACHTVSPGHGMALVADAIADVQPDTIVTFGPDGLTGHTDHQAISRWASNAWAATGARARLLWAAVTADAFYPGYPIVAPDHSVSLQLDLRGELLDRKFSAIRAHATQSAALVQQLGEDNYRRWWSTESYIDVSAAAGPVRGPRRRSDLFNSVTRTTTRSSQCTAHT
jgi:LmbE family N-acetylglucosaminyl deacetylase